MSIFTRVEPPRTTVNADNPCLYEDGLAISEFFTPSSKYFGRQTVAVQNKRQDGAPTFMVPIAHFHLLQSEEFYVESGRGYWYMSGEKMQLKAGDSITIPRCKSHWFENDPDSLEPLVILYQYDPVHWNMMERFFRNVRLVVYTADKIVSC
jgi:mannose-6-phosphate isomerase-like protein (cupin superfamily)